jgi:hypothetical protein
MKKRRELIESKWKISSDLQKRMLISLRSAFKTPNKISIKESKRRNKRKRTSRNCKNLST